MAELYSQDWASVAPDVEALAMNPARNSYYWDPTYVYIVDPAGDPQSRELPKPTKELRQFLCNEQCPKQCATLHCPWNSMCDITYASPEQILAIFGKPCMCRSSSCLHCVQERALQKFQDCPSRVAGLRGVSLQDPPPIGYEVYDGIGEPVSGSLSMKCRSKLYRLECVPWSLQQRSVQRPPGTDRMPFFDLSLTELLHFN